MAGDDRRDRDPDRDGPTGLADWRRRVAELYAEVRATARPTRRPRWAAWARRARGALPGASAVAGPGRGAGDVPGAALAVRRPAAVRGRRRARRRRPPSGLGGLAGLDLPNSGAESWPSTGSVSVRLPSRRRGVAVAVLDARLRRRPVPAVPRRDQRRRDVRRRPLPARYRARARTSAATRPPARSSSTSTSRSSRRARSTRKWACPLAPPENRLGRADRGRRAAALIRAQSPRARSIRARRPAPAPARTPQRTGRSRAASRRRRPACRRRAEQQGHRQDRDARRKREPSAGGQRAVARPVEGRRETLRVERAGPEARDEQSE